MADPVCLEACFPRSVFRKALRAVGLSLLMGWSCLFSAGVATSATVAIDTCLASDPTLLAARDLPDLKIACDAAIAELHPEAAGYAAPYRQRGLVLMLLGDSEGALRDYDTFIAAAPAEAEGYHLRGGLFLSLGLYEKAEAELTKSLSIQRTWQTLNARCWARYNLAKRDAWTDCDEAVAKSRNARTLVDTAFMTGNANYALEAEKRSDADARVFLVGSMMWQRMAADRGVNAPTRKAFMTESLLTIQRGLARFPDDPLLQTSLNDIQEEMRKQGLQN